MSNTITVYLIDQNGAYLHEATANQLADGSYNVPWNGVLAAPPTAAAGQVPQWGAATQSWTLQTDNRSETVYVESTGAEYSLGTVILVNGNPAVYSGIGAMPSWLTTTAPAPATDTSSSGTSTSGTTGTGTST